MPALKKGDYLHLSGYTTHRQCPRGKTHFLKFLERAHQGQEVILAKAGKPYARLMPLGAVVSKCTPGRLAGLAGSDGVGSAFFEPLPDVELAAWSPNEAAL